MGTQARYHRRRDRLGRNRLANTAVARKKSLRLCLSASPVAVSFPKSTRSETFYELAALQLALFLWNRNRKKSISLRTAFKPGGSPDFRSNETAISHSLACAGMVRHHLCCGGLPNEPCAGRACESGGDLPALDRIRFGLRTGDCASSAPLRNVVLLVVICVVLEAGRQRQCRL